MTQERTIFGPYWTGSAQRFADPLMIRLRYQHACNGKYDEMVANLRSKDPDTLFKAYDGLIKSTWYAFELEPFDPATGKGTTPTDTVELAKRFAAWQAEVKKKSALKPTSAPVTTSGPGPIPPPTSKSSGCGCKGTGLPIAGQRPFAGASVSPVPSPESRPAGSTASP